MLILMQAWIF